MSENTGVGGVYTLHQLEQLGQSLAERHQHILHGRTNQLLSRLRKNEEILRSTYKLVTASIREGQDVTPAGEWLLDNFYIIEEQIKTSKLHLPRKFGLELPVVEDPVWKAQPRVYILARELINHADGRLDNEPMRSFVNSYQKKTPLRIGELWAFPIMLRLGLIDNLRHIAESVATNFVDQRNAKFWADKMVHASRHEPKNLIIEIAEFARSEPRLSSAFVSEFARRIQALSRSPALPLGWLEQQLSSIGISIEQHQYLTSQEQAHDHISIGNSIGSLRFLNDTDWRDFVESMSSVDAILRQDPTGTYPAMDFSTRDTYRHRVEYIARFSKYDEMAVANAALSSAQKASAPHSENTVKVHIGEFLVGSFRRRFESTLQVRRPFPDKLRLALNTFPLTYYIGLFVLLTSLLAVPPLLVLINEYGLTPFIIGVITLFFISASQAALSLINWLTSLIVKPEPWSRMDYSDGVPSSARTMVAVPSMLSSIEVIQKLISDLEVRYLSNCDKNISFALLTDFCDSTSESQNDDAALLAEAKLGIETLNEKYLKDDNRRPFYLFHRPRLWNPKENMWMGYERKRGKISEFNAFLRGKAKDRFATIVGDLTNIQGFRYVITLDEDSTLPRDCAKQLIATMAHPLNLPKFDAKTRLVNRGYAILQPRVTIHLRDTRSSRFTQLFSEELGLDPYTKAVSDIYQDLFHAGSFIGKGIYDVDAFQKALEFRFPENRILSHDLIESGFARSGLVSDVQLVEEYPSSYAGDANRLHRWIRGDWQIASWMLPIVPNHQGISQTNPLSVLSRWKIFDNLRRSLAPIASTLLFLLCWELSISVVTTISLWLIIYLALPQLLYAIKLKSWFSPSISLRGTLRETLRSILRAIFVTILHIVFLPYDAYLSFDAMLRSLYRLTFSKRKLLQWQPAAESGRRDRFNLIAYAKMMWFAPAAGIFGMTLIGLNFNFDVVAVFPIYIGWFAAPYVAWWISQPLRRKSIELQPKQTQFLHHLACQTWLFFDTFVSHIDNWLPPDNFQEYPEEVIAHRTSPTNIGLMLLSTLGAYDFGYLSVAKFIQRMERSFNTLKKLERFKGHFYNWYDTRSLKPLSPQYISTVDSGNLAGSLLIIRQGINEILETKLLSKRIFGGIGDVVSVIARLIQEGQADNNALKKQIDEIQTIAANAATKEASTDGLSVSETTIALEKLKAIADTILQNEFSDKQHDLRLWTQRLTEQIKDHRVYIKSRSEESEKILREQLLDLAACASELIKQDYSFLYNKSNKLLAIGYHVADSRRDQSFYDLLASEARLASFLAIANGHLPQEHWFALGRQLVTIDGVSTLLSWSGSMFEYLMPLLIMPSFEGTLLEQSCRQCVLRQIEYGKEQKVPWGISESGYNITDAQYNYQYRAFGVPGLGLKRGLDQDLVIAPYAAALALMVEPLAACENLKIMQKNGFAGKYGLYEAIDFTQTRIPAGEDHVIIRSFMAHHQGMIFLSLVHLLLNKPMQRRMQDEPRFKATELLLHERIPKTKAQLSTSFVAPEIISQQIADVGTFRIFYDPNQTVPDIHLLGNDRYHVMISSAGSGYSTWNNLLITRWREDRTRDAYGYFIYIRDEKTGKSWSSAYQPMLTKGEGYEVIFSEGRAEFKKSNQSLDMHTEIAVSPDDNAELRRVSISNRGKEVRIIEVTTYAEVVLAPASDDLAHPAFSNLFVETELIGAQEGLLCQRRSREPGVTNPWLYHAVVVHGCESVNKGFETDRTQFIGRNLDPSAPYAMNNALRNSSGPVLDPIVSMRKRISIPANGTAVVDCIMGVCEERADALNLVGRFKEKQMTDRVLELSWSHGHVLLQQLSCTTEDATLYGKIAASLIYGGPTLRCDPAIVRSNAMPKSALWSYGISGDLPILLLRLQSENGLKLLHKILKGHDYWHRKGVAVDLVIWNESLSSYLQTLHDKIIETVSMSSSNALLDKSGGIFIRRPDQMHESDRNLFRAAARLILSEDAGNLAEQMSSTRSISRKMPVTLQVGLSDKKPANANSQPLPLKEKESLSFDNGFGGFSKKSKEYVISVAPGKKPPMPWVNVIANSQFGTLVSESGSAYTWSENAHEYRLTPWFNDPISDPTGEALYIRDEQNARVWSATPGPCPTDANYEVRHGFGYSTFATLTQGISSLMTTFVAQDSPVKIVSLKLVNQSNRRRQLSVTSYFELVLGDFRSKTASQIITESDPSQNLLLARNGFSSDFPGRVIFLGASESVSSITGDRSEFIGRNGSLAKPAALERVGLSGRTGALYDPCFAMQINCDLDPGAVKEIAFVFGAGRDYQDARKLARQFRSLASVYLALSDVRRMWDKMLHKVNIDSPNLALNLLTNGWLLYQTISSRIWGRTGFYQSGGAYGFRDQLQDVMAVVYCAPEITREHLIKCAGRQFIQGDVQHWWHPPQGRGVRTTISDDYLWLPYVTAHYIKVTGDWSILDENVPFLDASLLLDGQDSDYMLPTVSEQSGSIYEHCIRALKNCFKFGVHGLPLMGSGDWNDGMNRVGNHGKGESVWLGFFLIATLKKFSPIVEHRGDHNFLTVCDEQITRLKKHLDESAWDGAWYLRAFFDDGTPLGSAKNDECRIDSLPQTWSVLSGGGSDHRAKKAMESVYQHLVHPEKKIIQLLSPPFNHQLPNPGYICGYLPGVRENGGQYTHAALWAVIAFAELDQMDRALELLEIINPINHSNSSEEVARYKVEPYVISADVYSLDPHCGRGGWSWYTGAAGWFYRSVLETLLGFDLNGDKLRIKPKLPTDWSGFRVTFVYHETNYTFEVKRGPLTNKASQITLDGIGASEVIHLLNDQKDHHVVIELNTG